MPIRSTRSPRLLCATTASCALALGATLVTLCPQNAHATPTPTPLPPDTASLIDPETPQRPGYLLTASDEFNSTDVNRTLFSDEYLPHWSAPGESTARYEVSHGTLKLRIDRDQQPWDPRYDGSTRVSSLQTFNRDYQHAWTKYPDVYRHVTPFYGHIQKYGYFELRAKVAPGAGVHSAWWMTGVQQDQATGVNARAKESGEVDIFEILGRGGASEALMSTHTWGDLFGLWPTRTNFSDGSDYSAQWHTYGFDWTRDHMDLYIDGKLVHHSAQSPNYPMVTYIGVYEKREQSSWTGPYDPSVPYPKTFEVDYFRAYQARPTLPYAQEINDGFLRGHARADGSLTRWLGGEGHDATLTQVYAPADGLYRMGLDFRSGEERDISLSVNGGAPLTLRHLNSGSFRGSFKETGFSAPLRQGWNTVRFFSEGLAPDLGLLHVYGEEQASQAPISIASGTLEGSATNDRGITRWLGGSPRNSAILSNVWAPHDGVYTLEILYRCGENRSLSVEVNGTSHVLSSLNSGSFSGAFATAHLRVPLSAGMNTVRLGNPSAPAPDLLTLQVSAASE